MLQNSEKNGGDDVAKTLTTREAARELGLTDARIRQLTAAGLLQAEKRGRDWFIDAESVEERKKKRK